MEPRLHTAPGREMGIQTKPDDFGGKEETLKGKPKSLIKRPSFSR